MIPLQQRPTRSAAGAAVRTVARPHGRGARPAGVALVLGALILGSGLTTSCGNRSGSATALRGTIVIDGSSSVFPLLQAAAEDFHRQHPGVRFTVGSSGTSGGFGRFTNGETDLSGASRPIDAREVRLAETARVRFCELPLARDGLTVAVSLQNDFVDQLSASELQAVFGASRSAESWAEVRPGWPDVPVRCYGPGPDSGSHGDFARRALGPGSLLRDDLRASEDDHQLIVGIASDPAAVGFFGRSYLVANRDRVRAVPIDMGNGPVGPDEDAIADGSYDPLARPLFVYVALDRLDGAPALASFVRRLLQRSERYARRVGYVPLDRELQQRALDNFAARRHGSQFPGPRAVRRPLREVYR